MNQAALRRYIPLALSWREQLQNHPGQHPDEAAMQQQADAALRHLREKAHAALREQAKKMAHIRNAQEALPRQLERGKLTPKQVNDKNRLLLDDIASLEAEAASLRRLIAAETAEEAGGFVAMALGAYREALAQAGVLPRTVGFGKRLDAEDRHTILVTAVVLILGLLLLFYFMRWRDQTHFEMVLEGTSAAPMLFLHTHSNEPLPIYLLMPWHEAVSIAAQDTDTNYKQYQIGLSFRFEDDEAFRALPPTEQAWSHDGRELEYAGPVRILPQLSETVQLNLGPLRERYPEAIGMRLQVRNARGQVAFSETVMW